MIRQLRLIRAVRHATDQHEASVAIAAIDIAMLVDLKKHARMAERGGDARARTVTGDAGMAGADGLGRRVHAAAISKAGRDGQSPRRVGGQIPSLAATKSCLHCSASFSTSAAVPSAKPICAASIKASV